MTKKSQNLLWAVGLLLVLGLVAATVAVPYFRFIDYGKPWIVRGQFGDMFGAANALLSGLALFAVIFTVHLQRKDLKLQQDELQLQREQLTRSAKAQEASVKALRDQTHALRLSARVASISTLLDSRNQEMAVFARLSSGTNKPVKQQIQELEKKLREILLEEFDAAVV